MKILLINPPAIQTIEEYDEPDNPSISIAYLAGYLRSKNIDVDVIDGKLERLNFEQTIERFKKNKYDIVGLTSYTHDVKNAHKLASLIKQIDKKVLTLIGGVHATAIPVETLEKLPDFDAAIVGEGEYIIYDIAKALEENKSLKGIEGVYYRENGQIIPNPIRMREQNLDVLPLPAWDMFPTAKKYQIIGARGCPNFCSFCMSPYGRKIMRFRSPENVIQELEWIINTFHPVEIRFNDETFSHDMERTHKLLDMIIERNLHKKTTFRASTRANKVDYPLLLKIKKANFCYLEIGVETGDPEIIIKTHKGITIDQTERAVKLAKKAGLNVGCGFIIGHPGETKETAQRTMDFMVKLNPTLAAIGLMVPYPGTEVAELAKKGEANYRLLSTDWEDYNKQIGNALEMQNFTRKEMEMMQALGYLKLYYKNYRFVDLAKFMWTYKSAGFMFVKKQLGFGSKKSSDTQLGPINAISTA